MPKDFIMKKRNIFKTIGVMVFIAVFGWLMFLRSNKPTYLDFAFAYDFAMALRTNDPMAYDVVDSALHPRIDEWMDAHEVQNCTRENSESFQGGGTIENGYDIYFDCHISEDWFTFTVYGLFIEERETGFVVIDWGEIEEEIH